MASTRAPEAAHDAPQEEGGRSLWARPKFVLSALLVGLLVVAAIWLVVDDPDPIRPHGPQSTGAAPVPPGGGTGCGPDGGDQTPPSTAPDTSWQLLGSMAAPYSSTAGPADGINQVPVCFAADPVGALFAAANFVAANSDPELRADVLDNMVADSPGKDAAAADLAARGPGGATLGVQIAGFSFLSYQSPLYATVDLALVSAGRYVHVPLQLAWTDGDWKILLPVTGRPFDSMQAVPNLAGFVAWQGA